MTATDATKKLNSAMRLLRLAIANVREGEYVAAKNATDKATTILSDLIKAKP